MKQKLAAAWVVQITPRHRFSTRNDFCLLKFLHFYSSNVISVSFVSIGNRGQRLESSLLKFQRDMDYCASRFNVIPVFCGLLLNDDFNWKINYRHELRYRPCN